MITRRNAAAVPAAFAALALAACSADLPTDSSWDGSMATGGEVVAASEHEDHLTVGLCKTWLGDGAVPDVTWSFDFQASAAPTAGTVTVAPSDFPEGEASGCVELGEWPAGTEVTVTEDVPDGFVLQTILTGPRDGGDGEEISNPDPPSVTFDVSDISQVFFKNDAAGHPPLTVTKTANPAIVKKWSWEIEKSADQTGFALEPGETLTVNYDVTVSASSVSAFSVTGTIAIENTASVAATLESVSDAMTGGIEAEVECGVDFPHQLEAGETLNCTYEAELPDGETRTNTATVVTSGDVPGGSGTAEVDFEDAPVTEVDAEVEVDDTLAGLLGTVDAADAPYSFTYGLVFGTQGEVDVLVECGETLTRNVASFVTNDTGSEGSDDWSVKTTVDCTPEGCALSPGYWRTHSEYGPAPYDATWAELEDGADTPFFLSGQSYYEVMWTPPRGNAYYQLAFQYAAAVLNGLAGAEMSSVEEAMEDAAALFEAYTPAEIAALRGNNAVRAEFLSLAAILDNFNNGNLGPAKCGD